MGYYKDTDQIWKIWVPIDKKIRKVIFITFDKIFSNKASEELLKFLANDSNQDESDQVLNIKADIDFDSDGLESVLQIPKHIPNLILPLLSPLFLPLLLRLPELPHSI